MSKGVTIGAIRVQTDVMVIDSATFALAMYAITFEAKPLGEHPINTIPAAISGGKPLILSRKYHLMHNQKLTKYTNFIIAL
jgi:hypothetical protein